jgi:hypothetical protein
MFAAISLSFCLGLLVFYVPERRYVSVPEVWLPSAEQKDRQATLALPVKILHGWQKGIKFLPYSPGDPEIVALDASAYRYKPSACPNVYTIDPEQPSRCAKIGTIGGNSVYATTRRKSSLNMNVYMLRGDTLIAINAVHSRQEALTYLRSFSKVARRDADKQLATNRDTVEKLTAAIKQEKLNMRSKMVEAYDKLPFQPVLPATLPAGWVQYAARLGGSDSEHPTSVQVFYKKGRDRFVSMTIVPRATVVLGSTCGPTPGAGDAYLACSQVKDENYYTGGSNESSQVSLYIYRPIGDVVAILQTSVYNEHGQQLLFSDQILVAQRSIAKSLQPVQKERLKGAEFVGTGYDPYPGIAP